MSKICPYCKALKFNGETMGMCCASGKVKLPLLAAPPEPLKTFLTGTTSESKLRLFKTAIDLMPTDTHKIVISADKTPPAQHMRRYNAPTIDEVAIVMVGDQFLPRDNILHKPHAQLLRIAEIHRCYDALQYPIIFWDGADGYHFHIKLMNPATNKEINKKCSAMHYYSYRLMIRQDEDNYILKCRQLFHQYVVDMYAKIESELLLYIRLNQTKLRS
ncbi:hypothetical protein QYM36_020011 [Artemia franciscana]|uniref:Helitron helicase-like domain-containing protein n=1 Tax=Artemia franciscana TaxID=6661 RepID=A0AA88H9G4_ARTSF|nr:hypothetical protein QYM36_020011 [Artemia franciscana]